MYSTGVGQTVPRDLRPHQPPRSFATPPGHATMPRCPANGGWTVGRFHGLLRRKSLHHEDGTSQNMQRPSVLASKPKRLKLQDLQTMRLLCYQTPHHPSSNTHISCVQSGTCRSRKMDVLQSTPDSKQNQCPNFAFQGEFKGGPFHSVPTDSRFTSPTDFPCLVSPFRLFDLNFPLENCPSPPERKD